MNRRTATFITLCALGGCGYAPINVDEVLTVPQVAEHIHYLDGKIVTVEGWLGKCAGYDCHISPSHDDMYTIVVVDYHSEKWSAAMDRSLSIGGSEAFDQVAAPLQFSKVRIKARINDRCWSLACTDRADILEPISIKSANIIG